MNVKDFKFKVKDRGGRFTNKSYGTLEWEEWYKLAEMTEHLYFGCDFYDGKCAKLRKDLKRNPNASEMCCCSQCVDNVGYLKFIQNKAEVIKEISSLFEPKVGFWRKGSGCSLPRKYRSAMCLGFRCDISKQRYNITGTKGMLAEFMKNITTYLSSHEIYILGKALLGVSIY